MTRLDRFGGYYGLPRLDDESDQQYQGRLYSAIGRGALLDVADACEAVASTGTTVEISAGAGCICVHLRLPLWRRVLVIPALRERRRVMAAAP